MDFGADISGSGSIGADIGVAAKVAGVVAADIAGAMSGGLSAGGSLGGSLGGSVEGGIGGSLGGAIAGGLEGALSARISGGLSVGTSGISGSLSIDDDPLAGLFGRGSSARESDAPDKKLEKLKIFNLDESESSPWLTCLFNPEKYTVSKENKWDAPTPWRPGYPLLNFTTAGGETIKIDALWFDTYLMVNPEEATNRDVRFYTDKLLALMKVDPKYKAFAQPPSTTANSAKPTTTSKSKFYGRPPLCRLQWGSQVTWTGALTSLTFDFELFDRDGTPVRAKVTGLQFKQVRDDRPPRQNPTSGGDDMQASHTVLPGDTLESIAYRQYGDAARWRVLAQANGLENPRALRPGQRLRVP